MSRLLLAARLIVPAACALVLGCAGESQRLEQSQLGSFARFGRSIDIAGTLAVVSAYQENSGQGAAYVFARQADAWSLDARVTSPSPSDEQFGDSVAISGSTLVVGAPLADQAGAFRSGAVYVYERSGASWAPQATLSSSGGHQAWEAFGVDVALDGNLLAVSAVDRDQGAATDAGAVFVFRRSAGVWSLVQQLAAPTPATSDKFGSAIDVVGENIVVGALRRDHSRRSDAGAVYVYTPVAGTFTLAQTLTASDAASNDLFGGQLALEIAAGGARRLVVGAEGCDPAGLSGAGAAYVFDSPGAGAFVQTQKLVAADAAAGALFGDAVSVAGTRILIGAPAASGAAPGSGAAYTFELAGTWAQTQKLERTPSDAGAGFGSALAVSGANALIGAANEQIGTLLSSTGAAHAYVVESGLFEHQHVLSASGPTASQAFGRRLALGADRLAVVAAGRADVFRRDAHGWSEEQHLPAGASRSLSGVATDGLSVALSGRRTVPNPALPLGFVQVFTRTLDTWTLQQELLPDLVSTALPEESGNSLVVAVAGDTLALGARRWNGGDGRVFVYERAGGVWAQSQLFTSPQANSNFDMNFGNQVRLSGDTLVIAEVPSSGIPGSPQNGNVFIYTRASATADFVQQQVLTAPVPAAGDQFGAGIAISGDLLAVYASSAQLLRVYRRTANVFAEVWSSAMPDVVGESSFEVGLALTDSVLAIGASSAAVGSSAGAGEVRLLNHQPDDTYTMGQVLRASATSAGAGLGRTVALDGDRVVASALAGTAGRVYNFEL